MSIINFRLRSRVSVLPPALSLPVPVIYFLSLDCSNILSDSSPSFVSDPAERFSHTNGIATSRTTSCQWLSRAVKQYTMENNTVETEGARLVFQLLGGGSFACSVFDSPLLCTPTNPTPHKRFVKRNRRSAFGYSLQKRHSSERMEVYPSMIPWSAKWMSSSETRIVLMCASQTQGNMRYLCAGRLLRENHTILTATDEQKNSTHDSIGTY